MPVVEKNWQATRTTIKERCKFMLNNDLFSDVKFLVRKTDGESESKQVIHAHKFVLSISSPVFEAMFTHWAYSELAETRNYIDLTDCVYNNLLELFRYMYCDEVNLSGSNVMGVLYLAKKYMVPSLADKCTEYLQDNLDILVPSNIFSVLQHAQKTENKKLLDQCWKVIDEQTEAAVKSHGFATIERSLLEAVVIRYTLTIEEIELFKAVDFWATKECEMQGLAADGKEKRRVIGEQIVKEIRFQKMKQQEFATVVLDSDILKTQEIINIMRHMSSVLPSQVELSSDQIKRSSVYPLCCRFGSLSDRGWEYGGSRTDCIAFSVDKDILLNGVCFFGSENNTYSVDLKVMDHNTRSVILSKTGMFSSKLLQSNKFCYYGFEVDLTEAVLKESSTYCIEAEITGPSSLCGSNGVCFVTRQGVTFTFVESLLSNNGTTVEQGQFPELLFSRLDLSSGNNTRTIKFV